MLNYLLSVICIRYTLKYKEIELKVKNQKIYANQILITRKPTMWLKMSKGQDTSKTLYANDQYAHERILNFFNLQRNANYNYEISLYTF